MELRSARVASFVFGLFLAAMVGCTSSAETPADDVSSDEAALRPRACFSSSDCAPGRYCTTEDGVCNSSCAPGQVCLTACSGTCKKGARQVTPPPPPPPPPPGACTTDSDCRTFSDYCTGCDCRALASGDPDPVCTGPGVRCFADPCMNKIAVCVSGSCQLAP